MITPVGLHGDTSWLCGYFREIYYLVVYCLQVDKT